MKPIDTPPCMRRRHPLRSALLCWAVVWTVVGYADDGHEAERARRAVEAGAVLPLPAILQRLQHSHPGQVLEVELEDEDDRWIYEIKLLTPQGELRKLELDARTATVLSDKVRPRRARRED